MASLRNAIPQRTYRERAQPKAREKLGLLEKHKDYSARARDYNEKKKRLKILREKAANRNPDEFHFGMMSSRTKNGVKVADRGNKVLGQEVVKLMKSQDAGYLRVVRERVRRQRGRLEEGLVFSGVGGKVGDENGEDEADGGGARHTVFVDDEEAQQSFEAETYFDTTADGVINAYNRQRRSDSHAGPDQDELDEEGDSRGKAKRRKQIGAEERARREALRMSRKIKEAHRHRKNMLEALKIQEEQLLIAEEELDKQRGQMSNTVGGVNKNGVKFKIRERKR